MCIRDSLTGMQNMDFTTMENLLQSHDLSALDDADIRDSAYTDFFTTVNKKMTYKITKNKFDIQNGTARITVHMKYIDGTNIYAATIQEYTRKVAVAAYAGKEMTQDDIQEMLAALLAENASTADEKYSEIDITYPLIKIGSDWKIVSLDDTTVKVMCANFKSVKDEISSLSLIHIYQIIGGEFIKILYLRIQFYCRCRIRFSGDQFFNYRNMTIINMAVCDHMNKMCIRDSP